MNYCSGFLCLATFLLFSTQSLCDDGVRIIVLSNSPVFDVQLNAELRDLEYAPVALNKSGQINPTEFGQLIVEHGAAGLVHVEDKSGVSVWVRDPISDEVQHVETIPFQENLRTDASIAIQAVELLRARLMKIEQAVAAKKAAPLVAPQKKKEQLSKIDLEAGPAVTYGFSKLPLTLQMVMNFQIRIKERLSVNIAGLIPTIPMKVENEFGSVRARNVAVLLGPRLELGQMAKRVGGFVSVLVGPHFLSMSGKGNLPYGDSSDFIRAAVMYLRSGLSVAVASRVHLFAAFRVGFGLPRMVIIAGDEKLPFGNPLIGGSLGVAIKLN